MYEFQGFNRNPLDFTISGVKSEQNVKRNPQNGKDLRENIAKNTTNLEFRIDLNW